MCGILGVSVASGALPDLSSALALLAHRGPDDSGAVELADVGCALGHTRLSIIDLSPGGHQPMFSADGRYVISFNGEIYNYRELREQLVAEGDDFASASDTEVLLKLCIRYGHDALRLLNGMFAFAFLDRVSGEMLLARDGLGVKPLYYAADEGRFWFASEIGALIESPKSGSDDATVLDLIDVDAVVRYLKFLWCPGDGTPSLRIRKLEPGCAMVVSRGRVLRQWAWYRLPELVASANMSAESSIKLVRDRLEQAVQRQLVADVPLGGFLSGGLDSSAVAYFACAGGRAYDCFTIAQKGGVDPGETDDLPYAREVAKHLRVPLHEVEIEADRAAHDFRELVWWMGEPLADPAAFNVLYICLAARMKGIKVLLSGTGGDDLFTGYRRHTMECIAQYSDHVPVVLRSSLRWVVDRLVNQKAAGSRKLSKLLRLLELPPQERILETFVWTARRDLRALLAPSLRSRVQWDDIFQPMRAHVAKLPSGQAPLNNLLSLEQRFFLADHNLSYTDRLSMAAGIEVRVPFLDQDLIEAAASIPLRFKQHGTVGKWVLREAMRPFLPASILNRPKSGFGAPLRRWIQGGLASTLDDLLSRESILRRGLFDPAGVQDLRQRNARGQVDAAYTLFSLAVLEQWCRFHVDGAVCNRTLVPEVRSGKTPASAGLAGQPNVVV